MSKRIGIIVGRFQVSKLHAGHKYLISEAIKIFDEVHLFLGITKGNVLDKRNPLPLAARRTAILEDFPQLYGMIHSIEDIGNWPLWVKQLDDLLEPLSKDAKVCIFGSRDSIVLRYTENGGKYEPVYLDGIPEESGTKSREEVLKTFEPTWDLRDRNLAIWLSSKIG